MSLAADARWMAQALSLGRKGLGRTWPNPAVGCVLVGADGRLIARGRTANGGGPHAEIVALNAAGDAARGATAYVSLEPCAHRGKTGPCAEALVEAGISRCVVAIADPYSEVAGRGLQRLRQAGIDVVVGVGADRARFDQAGFLKRVTQGLPLVTLKLATSLDGRIATAAGESRWITGAEARAKGHLLRAQHDAIALGIGTVLADDPGLDCRLPGLEDCSPVRVVFDSQGRLSASSKLAKTAGDVPVWRLSGQAAPAPPSAVEAISVPMVDGGRLDPKAALKALASRGVTRVLVEGGGRLAASLLKAALVDRLALFTAPCILGGDALAAVGGFDVRRLAERASFRHMTTAPLGPDRYDLYVRED